MSRKKDQQQGFTLIELMLSMTFIAIMLVAIAMCVIQMSTIYTRAETLRQINQSSRTISNDLRQTLAGANQFVVNADDIKAGRLCTGAYTYVWNAPSVPAVAATDMSAAWPAAGATANKYADSTDVIGFVRVQDAAGAYCGTGRTTAIPKAKAVELLPAGDRALTVRRLRVASAIQDSITKQQLYTFDIVLSTNNTNAIETTADSCVPPGGSGATNSELAYCAVNQISITVRAGVR